MLVGTGMWPVRPAEGLSEGVQASGKGGRNFCCSLSSGGIPNDGPHSVYFPKNVLHACGIAWRDVGFTQLLTKLLFEIRAQINKVLRVLADAMAYWHAL